MCTIWGLKPPSKMARLALAEPESPQKTPRSTVLSVKTPDWKLVEIGYMLE